MIALLFNRLIPLALMLAVVLACATSQSPNNSSQVLRNTPPETPLIGNPAASTPSNWDYSETKDPMGRGTIYRSTVLSSNTISLSFPYEGEQRCRLSIRQHPQHGSDVYVSIEKGQLLDSDYHGGVIVRFDDDKPKSFSSASPADGSSETLFLQGGAFPTFLSRLKTAKTVKVQVPVYQAGNQICEFDVDGFSWKK
jgi:hypothetical protein